MCLFSTGFLKVSTVDWLCQMNCVTRGCPGHHMVLSSSPGLYLLGASSSPALLVPTKMSPDTLLWLRTTVQEKWDQWGDVIRRCVF